jgi:hypothetical protein
MRKRARKLGLSRETLRHLQSPSLRQVQGGTESGTCPTDCGSTECSVTCYSNCGQYSCDCTSAGCPPPSEVSGCPICG